MQITGFTRSSSTLSKNSSFDRYESIYLHHIKPVLGDIQIASIRSEEIQNLLVAKSKTLSYSVVKKINFLLSELFQYAHSEGDIAKNPMRNVKMPKKTLFKPEREIIALESEEVRALEQVAVMKRKNGLPLITHANLIVFLVHTGLRCGELQALKWSDIDFCSKTVTVNKNLSMVCDRDRNGERKNHKKSENQGHENDKRQPHCSAEHKGDCRFEKPAHHLPQERNLQSECGSVAQWQYAV